MRIKEFSKRDQQWYKILYIIAAYFFIGALIFDSPIGIFEAQKRILTSPAGLLTDYMEVGSIGGALFNAGLMTLIYTGIFQYFGVELTGPTIASVLNLTAFTLLGKNVFNTMWLFAGGFIFGYVYNVEHKNVAPAAIFATGIAPLMSYTTFVMPIPNIFGYILGLLLSLLAGFFLPMLTPHTLKIHKKHSLYNSGMALGFIIMAIVSVIRAFGFDPTPEFINMGGRDIRLIAYVLIGYGLMTLPRLIKHKGLVEYLDLIKNPGLTGTSYVDMYEMETVLFNMGLVGLAAVSYVLIVGADVNGLTMGAAFAVPAFATAGTHIKNVIPIMLGVALCALITDHEIAATGIVMAALFGTTVAPMAGSYGFIPGIIAGFMHLSMVTQFGRMHGNLLLYNNGLTGGVVAFILVSLFDYMGMKRNTYNLEIEE